MIPMLTLGVPGDAVTAIMIGALTIQGLAPGPMLFETNEALVYSIFLGMFVANTLMCIFGFAGIRLFTKVLSVPKGILTPIIFVLCIIGSFAMKNSLFDVWVMLVAGIVGYFLGKVKVPTSPAILGLILGPMAEKNFRTALLKSGGDPSVFFDSVIWLVLHSAHSDKPLRRLHQKSAHEQGPEREINIPASKAAPRPSGARRFTYKTERSANNAERHVFA